MISVLIPTFNCDVRELVKSVHKQCTNDGIDFEICVLDDCSTDGLIDANNQEIASLSNVTFNKNEKNLGRTATRNKLAENTKFEWLLFLDADVLPKTEVFIANYLPFENKDIDCICGGITYTKTPPEPSKMLRWVYGKTRETKTALERSKNPYDVVSPNLFIKKNIFLKCNPNEHNAYGMDIIFSDNLKKNQIVVAHIDNPVVHLGLESSSVFLQKSLNAVTSTFEMESKKLLANNARPLQRVYLKLKRMGSIKPFQITYALVEKRVVKNLVSKKPSMRLFDAFKLNHYIKLKNDD